jgi:predicted nucleic acid-binding protein
MILVDAGPMVALIHADDHHHERCKEVLRSLKEPMATVWPPVTEAMYLPRLLAGGTASSLGVDRT